MPQGTRNCECATFVGHTYPSSTQIGDWQTISGERFVQFLLHLCAHHSLFFFFLVLVTATQLHNVLGIMRNVRCILATMNSETSFKNSVKSARSDDKRLLLLPRLREPHVRRGTNTAIGTETGGMTGATSEFSLLLSHLTPLSFNAASIT